MAETTAALRPTNSLLFAADMAGTLLFAIEGAEAAIPGNLDLLGLMVLAFSTALAGGIFRDLLIGAVPPSSLRDWRYSAMAFTGAAIVFLSYRYVAVIPSDVILVLDAAGLALFAVAGAAGMTARGIRFGPGSNGFVPLESSAITNTNRIRIAPL